MEDQRTKEFKLKKKLQKKHPNFVEVAEAMSLQELKGSMSKYARYKVEVEQALKNDEEIVRLNETLKELKAPYRDTLTALKEKMQYIYILLKEQEGLVSDGQKED